MEIKKIRLRQFKSIIDSGYINVDKKFTILAGKNNTGKSAFLDAIVKCFFQSSYNMEQEIRSFEIEPNQPITIPFASLEFIIKISEHDDWNNNLIYEGHNTLYLEMEFGKGYSLSKSLGLYIENEKNEISNRSVTYGSNGGYSSQINTNEGNVNKYFKERYIVGNDLDTIVAKITDLFIYISSVRVVASSQSVNSIVSVSYDGSNLHSVLHAIRNNYDEIFDRIESSYIKIFPEVKKVRTKNIPNSYTNIALDFEGLDYSIPLQNCGTGYTFVLHFLCIIFIQKNKIILFDEPNSFLHPSAEKDLYDIAKNENGENNFIFTTHSPILINFPIEKDIYLLTKKMSITNFNYIKEITSIFDELGLSNSDFALSDKIIFVEGETEDKILPMIFHHFGESQIGYNYRIINFDGGNRFGHKNLKKDFNLYKEILDKISHSPIPYKVVIDKDEKSEKDIQELRDILKTHLVILDRWEIENYYFDCEGAIFYAIVSSYEQQGVDSSSVTFDKIRIQLKAILENPENNKDKKLFPNGCKDVKIDIKGSEVISRIIQGQYYIPFSKPKHGKLMAEWILKNDPKILKPIFDYFVDYL